MVDERLEFMKYLANKAGGMLKSLWRSNALGVRYKEDGSVLTDADLRVRDLVRGECEKKFPSYRLLTEESKDSLERLAKQDVFIVDELDGTHEFSEGKKEFCFMVAYTEKGVPKIGVVYEPAKGRLFSAEKHYKAYLTENECIVELEPLRHGVTLENALVGDSVNYKGKKFDRMYEALNIPRKNNRISGAIGTRMMEVALQNLHIIPAYHRLKEWDVAAGDVILEARGIPVVDFKGNSLIYNKSDPRMQDGVLVVHPDIKKVTLENVACLGKEGWSP